MNCKRTLKTVASTLTLVALLAALGGTSAHAASEEQAAAPEADSALAFTSAGQVLRFASDGLIVSNGRYALRVDFARANLVDPQAADDGAAAEEGLTELDSVTYPGLWPGIDLTYDRGEGILRSTYTLAPGADPGHIRLRYNCPPALQADGSLIITFDGLALTESAPLAWQDIDGQRVPVDIAFQISEVSETSEVSFHLGSYDPTYSLTIDPTLTWNTFLGGSGNDRSEDIAVDSSDNIYVVGRSDATWGTSPVRAHYGSGDDAFVARLDASGSLTWNTFLGGSGTDCGNDIAVDGSGNIYVTGYSMATWGSPVRAFSGNDDAFAARLDSSGALTWNTFLGGNTRWVYGEGITVDGSGNVYVVGRSSGTWGASPVRAHSGNYDAFVARLATNGSLTWHTFLGGTSGDHGYGIAVDGSGNIYVAGHSSATWGTPVRAHCGWFNNVDAFAARLATNGALTWNTFLGGTATDYASGVTADGSGNVYVVGRSSGTWGTSPVRAHYGSFNDDTFVVRLVANTGVLTWNTFLGGSGTDYDNDITVDGSGNIYVAGYSSATWGAPVRAHYGTSSDGFAARLDSSGSLTWNTFLGSSGWDYGYGVALDSSDNVYVAGYRSASWGSPVRAHDGSSNDASVAQVGGCTTSITSGSWGNTTTWDTGSVPGSSHRVCIASGDTVTLGAAAAASWLDAQPGGVLDLATYGFTVENGVTNDSVISQTQAVNNATVEFLHIQNAAATLTHYRGLLIDSTTNGQNLGAVSISVRELNSGEYCTTTGAGSPAYTRRCYSITPAVQPGADVRVRLYARTADELNGITAGNLSVYRYASGWSELTTNRATGNDGGVYSYAEGDTFTFPSFLLGQTGSAPTAVTLQAFAAEQAASRLSNRALPVAAGLAVTAVAAVLGVTLTKRRRRA